MGDLFQVADAAYPHDDWSFLPATVRALGGYVGGHTPHAWTVGEVAHLEATGRPWWGIWTAEQGKALTLGDATQDAANMHHGLVALGRPKILPVFWDVEESTYDADPEAAEMAGASWCVSMRSLGYPHAGWYGPCHSNAPWRACWTGTVPTSLPAGAVGVQYAGNALDGRADLSIFSAAALGVTPPGGPFPTQGVEMLDPTDPVVKSIQSQLSTLTGQVHDLDYGYVDQDATPFVSRGEMVDRIRSIHANVIATAAKVGGLTTGGQVDVHALAAALATDLTPDLLKALGEALIAEAGA